MKDNRLTRLVLILILGYITLKKINPNGDLQNWKITLDREKILGKLRDMAGF